MKKYLALTIMMASILGCNANERSNSLANNQDSGNRPGTGNQVTLTWNSNLGEQQGFYVEESPDGTTFTQVLQVPDGTNTATVTVPTAGQTYYFRIRGYNQAGTSPYTSVVSSAMAAK